MSEEIIGRLLGPEGPEVGCDECFEQLDEYVDAELLGTGGEARHPGMTAHLSGCPACREEYDSLHALAASE